MPFKYLGIPIGANHRRKCTWDPMLAIVRRRLVSWNHKNLSLDGRIVLLQSVLTALPIYLLSFFLAPKGIILSLESLLKQFLWGGKERVRKICWVAWDDVCRHKEEGGLGIGDLRVFNLVLLGSGCGG